MAEDISERPSYGQEFAKFEQNRLGPEDSPMINRFRPTENLRLLNFSDLEPGMRKEVIEDLKDAVVTPFLSFSGELQQVVEGASARKYTYPAQNELEYMMRGIAQNEMLLFSTPEGQNEVILGQVGKDLVREKSTLVIYNWALPYLAMYWSGMDSLKLLSERGAQLPMADMIRFFDEPSADWLDEKTSTLRFNSAKATKDLKSIRAQIEQAQRDKQAAFDRIDGEKASKKLLIEKAATDEERQRLEEEMARLDKQKKDEEERSKAIFKPLQEQSIPLEIESRRYGDSMAAIPFGTFEEKKGQVDSENPAEQVETKELKESFSERYARCTSDSYFWIQIRGEMNTFNPIFGEHLNISETMQQFVFDISNLDNRLQPVGTPPMLEKTVVRPGKELFIGVLDYFNTCKSEDDRKWVIATTAAMAACRAKERLDEMPVDIRNATPEEKKKYEELFREVHSTAIKIMRNYDVQNKSMLELKIAKSSFDMAYAISFGSFSVGDWGWAYDWKQGVNKEWTFEGAQGDPTASGDAFTARRPWFHEVVYWAIKNRGSSPGGGTMMSIDGNPEMAHKLANALLSEAEQINQQNEMLEIIKSGKQLHIARFFGTLGAYSKELHDPSMRGTPAYIAWEEGENIRKNAGKGLPLGKEKEVNQNLINTIQKLIVYVPTPYTNEKGENLVYPMLMPQFEIGLFDMLRPKKYEASAGDMLRKTWAKDENGNYVEREIEKGGKRLTLREINFSKFAGYGDDGRAVNDNFISQLYSPLYGAPNPKNVEAMTSNPSVAITLTIKAADISTRATAIEVLKPKPGVKLDDKIRYAQRPSLEIIYATSDVFQNLAFGLHGLIGRGSMERMNGFLKELTTSEKSEGKKDNLYMVLRSVEDYLPTKQGYEHYSDSFYLLLLAYAEALKPITLASEQMAEQTTNRMGKNDTSGTTKFNNQFRGKHF